MKLKYLCLTAIASICLLLPSCGKKSKEKKQEPIEQSKSFDCDLFLVTMPDGYLFHEELKGDNLHELIIEKGSLNPNKTYIKWSTSNLFPGTAEQLVTLITSKEIETFEKNKSFYDVMNTDSAYVIDGFPTYSISSIYTEDEDTIIQSRTGMVVPDRFYMLIEQKANTKTDIEEVKSMTDIIETIRIK